MAGPGVAVAIAGLLATAGGTAATQIQAKKERKARKKAADLAASIELEAQRKDQLLESRENRLRQRRASGSGQNLTILGGETASQAEVGRNVLLGQ